MRGRLIDVLSTLVLALIVVAVVLVVGAIGTAGLLLIGRLLGGAFGVGTLETAAIALVLVLAIGLTLVWLLARPSNSSTVEIGEGVVPVGTDDPERPRYNDADEVYCPNCDQRLDLPASRAEMRRRK